MKQLTILLILIALYLTTRPPEPPVPFIYDPNQVNYEIIEAVRIYPHQEYSFTRKVVEPDGQMPSLSCSDPTVLMNAAVSTIDPDDPNGVSRIFTYDCTFPVNRPPGIYYLDFTVTDNDPNEPMFDNRTMLIWLWPKNRPPVIR